MVQQTTCPESEEGSGQEEMVCVCVCVCVGVCVGVSQVMVNCATQLSSPTRGFEEEEERGAGS